MMRPSGSPRSTRPATLRPAVLHWAAVAACVLAVEAVVALSPPPPAPVERGARLYPPTRVPSLDESVIHHQVARMLERPTDILLWGDSSALNGLDPSAFIEVTGLDAQNYGTVRWLATDGHADILELYVETHGPPRVAIYQMGTGLHSLGARSIRRSGSDRGRLLASFREWTGVPDDAHPIPLPSLSWRPSARIVVEGLRYPSVYLDAPRAFGWPDRETGIWLAKHRGMSVDHNPRPPDAWDGVPTPEVTFDPDCEPGFVRMFELSQEHGFALLVAHQPIPAHYRDDALSARYELVERRMVALAEPYPTVRILGPYARYVPTAAFANYEHLTPEGARQNSLQVASLVATLLTAPEGER